MRDEEPELPGADTQVADGRTEYLLNGWFGTVLMLLGSVMSILVFCDRTDMELFDMPAVWHETRAFHVMICLMIFTAAAVMLKSPTGLNPDRETPYPLFRSVRLLTRSECHLCDQAMEVLQGFKSWLPHIEVVDVDTDASLKRQFGESVPVVEFDGKIRFRGAVDPVLLRRLLLATRTQRESLPLDAQASALLPSDSTPG